MKAKKYWIIIAVIIIAVSVCFPFMFLFFKKISQEIKRASSSGTTAATNAALYAELDKKNTNLKDIFSSADQQWRFLTADEYDRVIIELARSHNLDPSPKDSSHPLLDYWGNRFEIAYRKLPNQGHDSIVVSKGPDRVYGTKDDITSPYGVEPPAKSDN